MRVLQLISSEGFYGAENVVAALTRDLLRSGYFVRLGIFENAHVSRKNNASAEFESRGLPATRILCRRRFDRAALKRIREIIHTEEIGLVHSHGYKADMYAYLATRGMRLPLLSTCHLWTRQTAAVRFYEFLDARLLRSFDAVVAVSDRIAAELRQAGVPSGKITTIDNGIDFGPFHSAQATLASELNKKNRVLIGTVGRLVAQKGLTFFLTAAQHLLKEFPDLLFAIVGDGPDRDKLEQLAKDLRIENKVCFTGARTDMPGVYSSLDIFALASIDEGMPMALLEAMASGAPAIATEVGAIPKVIVPGRTGMLVRPGDPAELAQALACLIRDPALRERMAHNAKQQIHEQFSSQVMTQNYCNLYERLLKRKNGTLNTVPVMDPGA